MILRFDRPRHLISLSITFLVLFSCATPSRTPIPLPDLEAFELEDWLELRSPDFILYSRGTRKNLEAYAIDLARFVAVVERLVQSQTPKTPARIVLVDGYAEDLLIPQTSVLGYMSRSLDGFSGFTRGSSHDPTTRHVLQHEFTHYLTSRGHSLKYPTWYSEGFAEFLGPTRRRANAMEVGSTPPWRLGQLGKRYGTKRRINLATIFSFDRGSGQSDPENLYAASWVIVHYLNAKPERQRRLVSMLTLQSQGLSWDRAFSRAFPESIGELENKLERHLDALRRGTPAAVMYLALDELDVRTDWSIRNFSRTEITHLLAEFAMANNIWATKPHALRFAEAFYSVALRIAPDDSVAHAGLAETLSAQGEYESASLHLAEFDKDPEPAIEATIRAGNAIQSRAMSLHAQDQIVRQHDLHRTAIDLYLRALRSDPESAFAFAGLGLSQFEIGSFEDARQSLSRADELGEWDAGVAINRGKVENATGFNETARRFWNEVVQLGGQSEAKRAATLLETLNPDQ